MSLYAIARDLSDVISFQLRPSLVVYHCKYLVSDREYCMIKNRRCVEVYGFDDKDPVV
jgi:hypothetical protein